MTEQRKREIEKEASDTRKLAEILTPGIADIFEVCDTLNIYYVRYPLGNDAVLGAAILRDDDYIIFSNSSSVYSREIFTVAHELGHIRLGHLNSQYSKMEDYDFSREVDEKEAESNYFAACFLMPREQVTLLLERMQITNWSPLEVARIQSIFNTSFDATINRLEALRKISPSEYTELLLKKADIKVSSILRAVGEDAKLCFPAESKAISMDYLKWVVSNYSNELIPKETVEKALGYLDIRFEDVIDEEKLPSTDDFDLDKFLEGNDE